jgi:hypothetical protein
MPEYAQMQAILWAQPQASSSRAIEWACSALSDFGDEWVRAGPAGLGDAGPILSSHPVAPKTGATRVGQPAKGGNEAVVADYQTKFTWNPSPLLP